MTERDNRAQDLVRTLLAEGWSQAEIARRIGRDPRLVRFVLKGLKPGTNLVEALTQLERGEEVTPPGVGMIAKAGPRRYAVSAENHLTVPHRTGCRTPAPETKPRTTTVRRGGAGRGTH